MKKLYAKRLKEYETDALLDVEKIVEAMKRYKNSPKKPTSVALDEKTIKELKAMAEKQGLPYQVLIRIFILQGLDRLKKAS
jgi:predicted DNA binding CopG/RHH family protein